jgi:SAM-dependent methyltransferase
MTDASDAVKAQYEEWVYPFPIPDLAQAISGGVFELTDPSLVRRKLWPRNVEPDALEILVAGCGSNQAAHLAFTNPGCRVVGIDISATSLDHQKLLKEKHQLANLELRQLPVEEAPALNQSFDLIVSTGVLHHLPDPDRGLRSLRDVLAPHGVMSIMVYGQLGRLGVYMMQDVLRLLGTKQDQEGLELVHHLVDTMPAWHPAHRYLDIAFDVDYDAGLVDTFLHSTDRAYTVPQVLEFARGNGLQFQSWLDNIHYSLSARIVDADDPLRQRADLLNDAEQWELMELFWQYPSTHRFLLCHVDRPVSDYTLDFSGDAWLDYVPSLRPPLEIAFRQRMTSPSMSDQPAEAIATFERFAYAVALDAFGIAAFELVDTATPIRRIVDETSDVATQVGWTSAEHVEATRSFFQRMAAWDHLQFKIP